MLTLCQHRSIGRGVSKVFPEVRIYKCVSAKVNNPTGYYTD